METSPLPPVLLVSRQPVPLPHCLSTPRVHRSRGSFVLSFLCPPGSFPLPPYLPLELQLFCSEIPQRLNHLEVSCLYHFSWFPVPVPRITSLIVPPGPLV